MKNQFYFILLFLVSAFVSNAQDSLFIKNVLVIKKGKTLTIKAGSKVYFSEGSRLIIEGSLIGEGTPEEPIIFCSENNSEPGSGVIISGYQPNDQLKLNHVKFTNLVQPLRFEPFWSRKLVKISNFEIKSCKSGESVIYIANCLKNLNKKPIKVQMINGFLQNNYSGILIENAGSQGVITEIDSISFIENNLSVFDENIGMLHLNLGVPYLRQNLKLGNFAFYRNSVLEKNDGLTFSGNADTIELQTIYSKPDKRSVVDFYLDNQLAPVIGNWKDIKNWPRQGEFLILDLNHSPQNILIVKKGLLHPKFLLDSSGNSIRFKYQEIEDSLKITYESNSKPICLVLENKQEIHFPEAIPIQQINKNYLEGFEKDSVQILDSLLPKQEDKFINTVEIGALGGLACFLGDVRHKFGIPGSFEWSGGFFIQRNHSSSVSFRLSYYRNNVSMHNPTAALFLWQSAPTFFSDNNGNIYELNSWQTNFKTQIHSFEFLSVWYFGKLGNTAIEQEKGRFIPAIGLGLGLMKYTPKRGIVYSTDKDSIVYTDARALGMEGQNFLTGKKKYGQFAMNIISSAELTYRIKRLSIRTEVRFVVTTTDYLDDMGQGYLFGGNYDKWVETNSGWEGPINKYTGKQITLQEAFPRVPDSSSRRTNNLLPDAYLQFHIGLSYNLGVGLFPWKNKTKKLW